MLSLILFVSCTGFSAWRVASLLACREPEPLTRVERGVWTGVLGLGLWLAQGHLLSFVGRFRAGALLATSLVMVIVVLIVTRHHPLRVSWPSRPSGADLRRRFKLGLRQPVGLGTLLPLVLVGLSLFYSVAALSVLPVSNHDALSYHFPKAAWLMTTGAFGLYPSQDLRVTYFPGNYEMLAATFLTFLRSDTSTGLITSASLLLFLASSISFFRRVWRDAAAVLLAVPMILASPVLFLHVTAHKNDILMATVTLNALIWLGRHAVHGGIGSAIVGVVSVALAVGTKFHGIFLVVASALLGWRAWRNGVWRPAPAAMMLQAVCVAALILTLGGAQYVANLIATGHATGILQVATPNAMNTVAYPAYWQVPRFIWMFLPAPLLTDGQYFRVPWSDETWFWPAYELYFSHYGIHVSVLILLLPLGVRWARRQLDASTRAELTGISIAAVVLVGLNLLIGLRPYGGFAFIPRFLFFALPVLFVWTWCPAVKYFRQIRAVSWLPLAASLAIPIVYIGITVTKDRFSPLDYFELLWKTPEWRREIFHSSWRAAQVVDRLALPDATVAIDSGYDGWTYPLYGPTISRSVQIIMEASDRYVPGPEVQWVAVDRAFSTIWGHPDFRDMSQASRYIDRGSLPERELRVYRSLVENPDFKLVYFLPRFFQAVFQRVRPVPAPINPSVRPALY
jgi:hypothetical protein